MAKKKITELIEEISEEFLAANGLELYNSEFVKEGRDWFLRVYIDKVVEPAAAGELEGTGNASEPVDATGNAAMPALAAGTASDTAAAGELEETGSAPVQNTDSTDSAASIYVSTDDCEKVSRFLSEELDRLDPIPQNYYLEVSSPGMDRVLLRDKDFARFAGEIVDVNLYKAMDGRKTYQGTLVGIENEKIVITDEKNNRIEFPRELVSKTRLAVIF